MPLADKTIWSAIGGLSRAISSFVAGVVAAQLLDPTGYGELGYVLWLASLAVAGATLGAPYALPVFIARLSAQGADGTARSLQRMLLGWIAIGSCFGLAGIVIWMRLQGYPTGLAVLGPVYFLALVAQTSCHAALSGWQDFNALAKVHTLAGVILIPSVAALAWWFGVPGAVFAHVLGSIPYVIALHRRAAVGRSAASRVPAAVRRSVVGYSATLWLTGILTALVWGRVELFFVERYLSAAELGAYQVVVTVAMLCTTLPTLLSSAFVPHFAGALANGEHATAERTYREATNVLALVQLPISLSIVSLAPIAVSTLFGHDYHAAVVPAAVAAVLAALVTIPRAGTAVVHGMGAGRIFLYSNGLGAAASVAGGLYLVPRYGLLGAVISRGISQSLTVGVEFWVLRRRLRFRYPLGYSLRLTVVCVLAFAPVAYCSYSSALSSLTILAIWLGTLLPLVFALQRMGLLPETARSRAWQAMARLAARR
jgi:O-antigen/teichoic acid export membrane protein